ncbi:MAG: hypothetical protein ACTHYC_01955 [Sphingobacterium sp.]
MKKTNIYLLTILTFTMVILSSCKKELDLDEDILVLIDKQEKLQQLDALYDLAFEDPLKAEEDYYHYLNTELLTEDEVDFENWMSIRQ